MSPKNNNSSLIHIEFKVQISLIFFFFFSFLTVSLIESGSKQGPHSLVTSYMGSPPPILQKIKSFETNAKYKCLITVQKN